MTRMMKTREETRVSAPKLTSRMSQHGFADPDLKTPKHDAICTWVDAEVRAGRLFSPDISIPRVSESDEIEAAKLQLPPFSVWLAVNPRPAARRRVKWEQPIFDVRRNYRSGDSRFLVGYIDLQIFTWEYTPVLIGRYDSGRPLNRLYADSRPATWEWSTREEIHWIEAKSAISSLGELFRQLNTYQAYRYQTTDAGTQVCTSSLSVASPDTRFAAQIREQGFTFIEVPGDLGLGVPLEDAP